MSPAMCHRGLVNALPVVGIDVETGIEHTPGGQFSYLLPPHRLLGEMCRLSPEKFQRDMGADSDMCFKFWCGLRQSESGAKLWQQHSQLRNRTPNDLRYCIPITIFEDGGPYGKMNRSAHVVSISSILSRGAEIDIKHVVATYELHTGDGRAAPDDPG